MGQVQKHDTGQIKKHEHGTDNEEGCPGRIDEPLTWLDAHAGPPAARVPDFYLLRRAAEPFGSVGRWSAGRGRPPQAAARRASLEGVEKGLPAMIPGGCSPWFGRSCRAPEHCARVRLLGDHGAMDVLSSRVLLHPTDPERSRVFYRDTLGLAIYREFGSGPDRGTVFFLGGGFLELSGRAAAPPAPGMALWLQVRELAAVRRELAERGVPILGEPKREPWGLLEMWIADPDGLRICIVEVPAEHPLRRRD